LTSTVQVLVSVAKVALAMHKKIFIIRHMANGPEFYVELRHAMQIIGIDIILAGRGRAKSALLLF